MLESLILKFCLVYGCETVNQKVVNQKVVEQQFNIPTVYLEVLASANNPSREAALTKQESAWRVRAKSPYAKGLRQFTDKTGRWAARTICKEFGSYRPYDGVWSLRCGIKYIQWLEAKKLTSNYCLNRYLAEQRYNGGAWVLRELALVETKTLEKAQEKCLRTKSNCKENYSYPIKISNKQTFYLKLGGQYCPTSTIGVNLYD